jgi:hypothetical protein
MLPNTGSNKEFKGVYSLIQEDTEDYGVFDQKSVHILLNSCEFMR